LTGRFSGTRAPPRGILRLDDTSMQRKDLGPATGSRKESSFHIPLGDSSFPPPLQTSVLFLRHSQLTVHIFNDLLSSQRTAAQHLSPFALVPNIRHPVQPRPAFAFSSADRITKPIPDGLGRPNIKREGRLSPGRGWHRASSSFQRHASTWLGSSTESFLVPSCWH
jgi:hypothetical protein